MSHSLFPVGEAAQADYEALREAVLTTGALPATEVALRFTRFGLAGLIARPAADPIFTGVLVGAERPAWSGSTDPRQEALFSAFSLVLSPGTEGTFPLVEEALS